MAPGKGKVKSGTASSAAPRRSARSRKATAAETRDATPDLYQEMVAEAVATDPIEASSRPLKRRKVSREPTTPVKPTKSPQAPLSVESVATTSGSLQSRTEPNELHKAEDNRPQQTAEYSSDSEESDFAFEDVDLGQKAASSPNAEEDGDDGQIADLSISVGPSGASQKAPVNRRKPATASEKAFRLRVHKLHFLTLLGHCMYANSRCNSPAAQKLLRRLVDKRMRSYLNPKTNDSQFQRNRSFMDGLEQAKNAFIAEFRVTTSGMCRPRWPSDGGEEGPSATGDPMDPADFKYAARDLEGSQDTGNQLFCAMLRATGVEARLVCSLPVLPFANPPPKSGTPHKQKQPAVFAIASDADPNLSDASISDGHVGTSARVGKVPSVRRRLGQPSFASAPAKAAPPKEKKKAVRTLSYPVYWVEAFNTAHQKWIPVDPMVTKTVGKATKIEPPASYDLNQMMYAIAFESNGVARDVTRRYAKAYNAKTRRQRVESSGEDGAKWFKKALRLFRRRQKLDRDQVEDAELAQKEAREGLPTNVLDFKDHPYYALERHLRRHEVLHPRRETGKVNAGTAAKPRMEPVFRRQDVLSCKSADKWYRLGREIKQGEQPLKHVPARASRRRDLDDEDREAEASTTGLYSIHQTQVYVPSPVKGGKITKNAFGNLDVYVPSMVPPGGTHIRHPLTQQAARILNIDFADAVTGFKFQGRQGTAIIEGAIVPQGQGEAVQMVIEGLEHEALEEESRARSLAALRLWARFMKGLRIAERVAAYGEKSTAETIDDWELDGVHVSLEEAVEEDDPTMPTAGLYSIADLTMRSKPAKKPKKKFYESEQESDGDYVPSARRSGRKTGVTVVDDDDEDEYMPDDASDGGGGGGFLPEDVQEVREPGGGFFTEADDTSMAGGFLPEGGTDNGDLGGGFVTEDVDDVANHGGAFTPEANNEEDGGFVTDDYGDDGSGVGFVPADGTTEDNGGGGFLVEGEDLHHEGDGFIPEEMDYQGKEPANEANIDDIVAQGKSPENNAADTQGASGEGVNAFSHATGNIAAAPLGTEEQQEASEAIAANAALERSLVNQETDETGPAAPKSKVGSDEDDDAGGDGEGDNDSLLSHDPEDDDADPDWLESD